MQRITRDHTVPVDRRYQVREPVARVELGETFVVETINFRTPIIRTVADANPVTYREREETGPIFVEGIMPGDVLRIRIEDIRPEGHASGGWWREPTENALMRIEGGRVHFPGGLSVPLHMMIGDIYVTPEGWPGGNPWDNGGNMDFRDIAAGNTLLLKAALPGGLLVLGDCHAAQGDGEILGLAAECAAEVTLTITKDEVYLPERPTIVKPGSFISLACRMDYAAARDLAVDDAKRILARLTGCTEQEAYLFITTVGDLRNGAVWGMGKTEPAWATTMPLTVGVEVPLDAPRPEQGDTLPSSPCAGSVAGRPHALGGPAVFVGSSIMAQWESLPQAFPDLPLLNTAIGGTQTHAILAMLDELVIRHHPPLVCYYCGSNDINAGVPVETIVANTLETFRVLGEQLSGVRFVYLTIIKAPQKRARWDRVDAVNAALATQAEHLAGFTCIDINPVFFTPGGEPWMGAYVEDQLHLTPEAYRRLGAYVAERMPLPA